MSERVLVIDSDAVTLGETVQLLERRGYDVVAASGPVEARRALSDGCPRVVVIEPAMDGADGFQLGRDVLSACGDKTPVLVMASHRLHGRAAQLRAKESGAFLYVERPQQDKVLIDAVALAYADLVPETGPVETADEELPIEDLFETDAGITEDGARTPPAVVRTRHDDDLSSIADKMSSAGGDLSSAAPENDVDLLDAEPEELEGWIDDAFSEFEELPSAAAPSSAKPAGDENSSLPSDKAVPDAGSSTGPSRAEDVPLSYLEERALLEQASGASESRDDGSFDSLTAALAELGSVARDDESDSWESADLTQVLPVPEPIEPAAESTEPLEPLAETSEPPEPARESPAPLDDLPEIAESASSRAPGLEEIDAFDPSSGRETPFSEPCEGNLHGAASPVSDPGMSAAESHDSAELFPVEPAVAEARVVVPAVAEPAVVEPASTGARGKAGASSVATARASRSSVVPIVVGSFIGLIIIAAGLYATRRQVDKGPERATSFAEGAAATPARDEDAPHESSLGARVSLSPGSAESVRQGRAATAETSIGAAGTPDVALVTETGSATPAAVPRAKSRERVPPGPAEPPASPPSATEPRPEEGHDEGTPAPPAIASAEEGPEIAPGADATRDTATDPPDPDGQAPSAPVPAVLEAAESAGTPSHAIDSEDALVVTGIAVADDAPGAIEEVPADTAPTAESDHSTGRPTIVASETIVVAKPDEQAVDMTPEGVDMPEPVIIKPRLLRSSRVQPRYPTNARRMGVSGTVTLRARVGTDGSVTKVEVLDEPPGRHGLGAAAAEAVALWRYRPATRDGEPIEQPVTIRIVFDR